MTEKGVLQALKESMFFGLLDEKFLQLLSKVAIRKNFRKEEIIFKEGDPAKSLYFIINGLVKIFKISEEGKEHIIHIFGNGEVFAEVALVENQVYPAWAMALTDTEIAIFERGKILKLLRENPEIALGVISLCIRRLRELLSSIENLRAKDVRKRLMLFLWEKSERGKNEVVDIGIAKKDLAILLGMTPETFSRVLKKFKEEGIIVKSLDNKKIKINLRSLANRVQSIKLLW